MRVEGQGWEGQVVGGGLYGFDKPDWRGNGEWVLHGGGEGEEVVGKGKSEAIVSLFL